MTVTVTPEQFSLVLFEAASIERIATDLLARLDMAEVDVLIEVDETTPIARISAFDGNPVVVSVESGSFEDPKRLRHLSEAAVNDSLGRVLLRLRDRRRGGFADAPADSELTLAQGAAWDTYAVARLALAGYPVNRQRWLYNFRNRHGFADGADVVFARLWSGQPLTWADLAALSDEAQAAGRRAG